MLRGRGATPDFQRSAARLRPVDRNIAYGLSWPALSWYVSIHLVVLIFAYDFFSMPAFLLATALYVLFGCSITLGAHRYFAHAQFELSQFFENVLATLYTLSFNRCGTPLIAWCAGHKFHHAHSETKLDPHSPRNGFWHAFCGHFIWRRKDLYDFEKYRNYCPSLARKPYLVWLERNVVTLQCLWIATIFCFGSLYDGGFHWRNGMSFVVYCVCVRSVYSQAIASLVDTLSHGAGPM